MREVNEPTRLSVSAHLVDARGKACPAPIIELAKALKGHAEVELWATDPATKPDLDAFAAVTGHRVAEVKQGKPFQAVVQRKR
ncbi:MAG: sulfurtransferase TusA family protein [Myxococcales bacterium]|nr:sulfurtransferase TusA family protein [Myxococcales bacterium]